MSTYTITKLNLAPTPTVSQLYTVNYKLWNATSYTTAATNVSVNTDGTLVTPLAITGLISGQTYNLQTLGQCGSPIPIFYDNIIVP